MKPYLYPNGRAHTRRMRPQNKKLILFILFVLLVILSFAQSGSGGNSGSGGGLLSFRNSTLESGTAKHARQTETLQIADVFPGTYVIRLSSGSEAAVQQIVKTK